MCTAELLVLESNTFEVEMAIEKLKRNKLAGIDQIPAELIEARGRTIRSEVYEYTSLYILFEMRRICVSSARSRSFYVFVSRATK
jgi:hypothetical protein